jgi:hypothetical protein
VVGVGRGLGAGVERTRERDSLETSSTRQIDARIAEAGRGGDLKGRGGRGREMETGAEELPRGREVQGRARDARGRGGGGERESERLCLHAWRLSFVHPTTGR